MLKRPLAALAAVVLLCGLAACGGGGAEAIDSPDGAPCTYNEQPSETPADLPPDAAAYDEQVEMTIVTSAGDLDVTLDAEASPCTVNSFTSLAAQGYFDDTNCHRLTTAAAVQVLQCGDPTGTGTGGPGYSFADEVVGNETYPPGTIAMANAGPDTNGSQFFFVYGTWELPAAYTVFGQVSEDSLDVLTGIADRGVQDGLEDGPPATPVIIDAVTLQ